MKTLLARLLMLTALMGGVQAATSSAEAATGQMSIHHAGTYYLKQVCTANDANDRFNQKIWRGRKTITMAEVRRRLPQLRHESRLFGKAQHHFSASLYNPPASWPQLVARNVRTMARKTAHDTNVLLSMGSAATAYRWAVLNGRHLTAFRSAIATSELIRAKLNLPAAGHGC